MRGAAIIAIKVASKTGARREKSCEIIGITVRTLERWEKDDGVNDKRKLVLRTPRNKLTEDERQMVLTTANSVAYRNLPPSKIIPMLTDLGLYIASESTFYRILRAEKQLSHRQISKRLKHKRPEAYLAHGPNQVWSWDISYLPTQVRGIYFYLYVIMDIYSRKIVGWSVHDCESAEHASQLIKQACLDENVKKEQLVLHSDNGSPMKGLTMLAMLDKLGVIPSFSRPSVSDDNPYSEALFRTLKYHPDFPMWNKFASIVDARMWCEKFANWYNNHHLHSALKFTTPQQRHSGEDGVIRINRQAVYKAAKQKNPVRWSGEIRDWFVSKVVSLNPNKKRDKNIDEKQEQLKKAA